jgi:23S rRNA (cytidine1920-2'-O)/16S rRNA (cytidine1409-2'-O)-methyltransferase
MAPTRSAAQRLIATGAVRWRAPAGWRVPTKSGEDLPTSADVEITDDAELRFVSRGGLKLDGALTRPRPRRRRHDLPRPRPEHRRLHRRSPAARREARRRRRRRPRPASSAPRRRSARDRARGVNARHLEASALPFARFDLVVGDLSFISLALVLPALVPLLGGPLLLLVKPQFELQPVDIGPGGKVKDASAYGHVEKKLRKACATNGLDVRDWFDSATPGSEGAREFFLHATRAVDRIPPP